MLIFCRKIVINDPHILKKKGPLLLACNHPNSFLDAAILADLFKHPVHSLTRGDVFKKPFYAKILAALKMLPVYRTSEGTENLGINYQTFDACKSIFKNKGIVLIFSEAKCVNEWHLRPLKKGTARLAFLSWDAAIPLEVLPVGINYSSFRRFSKNIYINFGEPITGDQFDPAVPDGKRYHSFNKQLEQELQRLVFDIDKKDLQKQKELLEIKPSLFAKMTLMLPATVGWLLHAPLYVPVKIVTYRKTFNNDHYDSVFMALLLFLYPLYVVLITLTVYGITHSAYAWLLLAIFPFTAWSYVQIKPQVDRQQAEKDTNTNSAV
jgi:1-acyl-sn-glycerol-3-phosphate acyltransferase